MDKRNTTNDPVGYYTGIGIALGVAFGVALDDVGTWTGVGAALGVAIGAGIGASLKKKQDTDDSDK